MKNRELEQLRQDFDTMIDSLEIGMLSSPQIVSDAVKLENMLRQSNKTIYDSIYLS